LGLTAQVLRGRRCIKGGPGNSLGLTGHVLRVPRHSLGPAVCRRDAPLELRAAPPTFRQGGRRCKRRPRNALACGCQGCCLASHCIGFGGSHLGFTMLSILNAHALLGSHRFLMACGCQRAPSASQCPGVFRDFYTRNPICRLHVVSPDACQTVAHSLGTDTHDTGCGMCRGLPQVSNGVVSEPCSDKLACATPFAERVASQLGWRQLRFVFARV